MPVKQAIATMKATSIRKIAPENVPLESTAHALRGRLFCGRDANV